MVVNGSRPAPAPTVTTNNEGIVGWVMVPDSIPEVLLQKHPSRVAVQIKEQVTLHTNTATASRRPWRENPASCSDKPRKQALDYGLIWDSCVHLQVGVGARSSYNQRARS